MKLEITTSSSEVMKAKSAPDITAGRICGRVTVRKACASVAPRLRAAFPRLRPTCAGAEIVVPTTKGMASTTWASTNPVMVLTRVSLGKKWKSLIATMITGTISGLSRAMAQSRVPKTSLRASP